MLVLLDRAFERQRVLHRDQRAGAKVLALGPCCRNPQVAAHLPGGSHLSGVDGLGVRIVEADVTATAACEGI